MFGGATALEIAFLAAGIATVFGVFFGAVSGFAGGVVDAIMMRIVDTILSIPVLFLLIVIAAILHPSFWLIVFIVALAAWLVPARLIRGETLTLRTREYVQAVRAMGGGGSRIVVRHIIPNAIGTIIVNATFQVADAIGLLAALGFLGFGVPPPGTSWGQMLSDGISYAQAGDWWLIYPAGICIILDHGLVQLHRRRAARRLRGAPAAPLSGSHDGPCSVVHIRGWRPTRGRLGASGAGCARAEVCHRALRNGQAEREVARRHVVAAEGLQAAAPPAAQMSWAAGQRVRKRHPEGGVSAEGSSPSMWWPRRRRGELGIGHRDRVDEPAGVVVHGRLVDVLGRADLDELAEVHDADAVGEELEHGQVVRDHDVGEPVGRLEGLHHVEDLGLDGHVKGRDGLVGDDEPWVQGERPREADPLALAAGELVRVQVDGLLGKADLAQQPGHTLPLLGASSRCSGP